MLLVLIALTGVIYYYKYKTSSNMKFESISIQEQNYLYFLLLTIIHFFKKYKINYWIMAGTLLGGVRNNPPGMLNWDDDIDVGILAKELPKLKKMFADPEFNRLASFNTFFGGYQITTKSAKMHIDIFIYHPKIHVNRTKNVTRYYLQGPHFQHEYIHFDEIFPTVEKKFWNTRVMYPKEPEIILKRAYGQDVLHKVLKYNHKQESFDKQDITDADRVPLHQHFYIATQTFLKLRK